MNDDELIGLYYGHYGQKEFSYHVYYCKLCDDKPPFSWRPSYPALVRNHIRRKHPIAYFLSCYDSLPYPEDPKPKLPNINYSKKSRTLKPKRTFLKPWKDPESLFCDTEFLKKLLNKNPTKGIECKDDM